MNRVKFGIIGLGSVSNQHIRSILESDLCELAAVCSRNSAKLAAYNANPEVATFTDYTEMLKLPSLDAVIICTPSGFHMEPSLAAAKAGKHILVEKPLEISSERAEIMIKASKDAGVKLSCIYQNRFNPDFQKLLQAVRNGDLGKLILGNAYIKWFRDQSYYDATNWRGTLQGDGGAALINQSIHTIDLLLEVMGPVKSVIGLIKTIDHQIEGEDIGTALLEFENGAIGTIEGSTAIYKGYPEKLEIHGSQGNIILEGGKLTQWQCENSNYPISTDDTSGASGSSDPTAIGHQLHKQQIEAFARSILNNSPIPIDGPSAMQSLQVVEAIYKSSQSGCKVVLQ